MLRNIFLYKSDTTIKMQFPYPEISQIKTSFLPPLTKVKKRKAEKRKQLIMCSARLRTRIVIHANSRGI